MKPHVLMVIEGWYQGGTERYVENLCEYLMRKKIAEVTLLVLFPQRQDESLSRMRELVREIIVPGGSVGRWGMPLKSILCERSFDAAHLHLYSSVLPVCWQLWGNVPVVTTFHMPMSQWKMRHRLGWQLSLRMSDQVVGVSRAVVTSLGRLGASATIISGTVNPPHALKKSRKNMLAREPFRVVGVGRLSREKDWPTFIKGMALLGNEPGRSIVGRIIGGGPQKDQLTQVISELKVSDRVNLVGPCLPDGVKNELLKADLFVLPSIFEGLPIAGLEAMSLGVPTIMSDFAAAKELVSEAETGNLFPIGDSNRLAQLIRWHRDHPVESIAMGLRGRAAVLDQFSEANTVAKYADIYARLTASHCQEACQ